MNAYNFSIRQVCGDFDNVSQGVDYFETFTDAMAAYRRYCMNALMLIGADMLRGCDIQLRYNGINNNKIIHRFTC